MKRLVLVSAVALVASIGLALAEDALDSAHLSSPAAAPKAFSWTGFYVGVNGGVALGGRKDDGEIVHRSEDALSAPRAGLNASRSGSGFAGGQVGHNLQIDKLVLGLEGEVQR